jgi:hypothetical protein
MIDVFARIGVIGALAASAFVMGCQSGGVGDPCTPEDEYQPTFAGYSEKEANIESRSFQCETRLCLVNHFRGRVSCPYGEGVTDADAVVAAQKNDNQASDANLDGRVCHIPGTTGIANAITVQVPAALVSRAAADTVYCSCRCGGDDPNAKYCDCPSGYTCTELLKDIGLGSKELAGSYCVKDGTQYDPNAAAGLTCDRGQMNCGNADGT